MGARKPLTAQLSQLQSDSLFAWLRDHAQLLMLCPAAGAGQRNYARLSAAESMLKVGLNTAAAFREYNQCLMQLEWAAREVVQPKLGCSYLFWHVPSGPLAVPTDIPGRTLSIDDPVRGWAGPCSGSNPEFPSVVPATRLLSVDVSSDPAWLVTAGVPAFSWEAAGEPLKLFLPSLKKRFRELEKYAA